MHKQRTKPVIHSFHEEPKAILVELRRLPYMTFIRIQIVVTILYSALNSILMPTFNMLSNGFVIGGFQNAGTGSGHSLSRWRGWL